LIGQSGDPCHEDFDDLRAARLLEMQQQQDFKKNFPERKKKILHQNFSSIYKDIGQKNFGITVIFRGFSGKI
jgi:hypothetical protein